MTEPTPAQKDAVEKVLTAFGGPRSLATKLDLPLATIEGWQARGAIPLARHGDILAVAEREAIPVTAALLEATDPPPMLDLSEEAPLSAPMSKPRAAWVNRLLAQGPAFALGGVVFTAGFLVALGTSDLWLGAGPPAVESTTSDSTALEKRLKALEIAQANQRDWIDSLPSAEALQTLQTRLEEVTAELARLAATPTVVDDPETRALVQALNTRLAELETAVASLSGLEQRLRAELEQRLTAAAETQNNSAVDQAARLLALGELRRAIDSGADFTAALDQVAALQPDAGAPLELLRQSQTGVPTLATLAAEFTELAPAVVAADDSGETGDPVDEALRDLLGLVTVRPTGEVEGDGTAARVARAELRLQEGDLVAALSELEGLSEAPKAVLQEWQARALTRQAVMVALEALQTLAATPNGG